MEEPGSTSTIARKHIFYIIKSASSRANWHLRYRKIYLFKWFSAVAQVVFFVSIGLVKMSITAFNMRLTGFSSSPWMVAHWTFFALLVCYTIVALR
jgi:hypothetical protein